MSAGSLESKEVQCSKIEIAVYNSDVTPGFLYDDKLQKYHQRNDGLSVKTVKCPVHFKIGIMRKNTLETLSRQQVKNQWMKDFTERNPTDAILVKGRKVMEIKALDLPIDQLRHTVTSVLYKGFAEMLIVSSKQLKDEWSKKLEEYLLTVLNGAQESYIPNELLKSDSTVHIYYGFGNNSESRQFYLNKHTLEEFCRILKESKVSTVPMSAYIEGPSSSNVKVAMDETKSISRKHEVTNESFTNYQVSEANTAPQAHTNGHYTHPLSDLTETSAPLKSSMRFHGITGEGLGSMDSRGRETGTQMACRKGQEITNYGVPSSAGAEPTPIHRSNTESATSSYQCHSHEPSNPADNLQMKAEHSSRGFSLSLIYNRPLERDNSKSNLGWTEEQISGDHDNSPDSRNKETLSPPVSLDCSKGMRGHRQSLRELSTTTKACGNQEGIPTGTTDGKDKTDEQECMRDISASQKAGTKEITNISGGITERNYNETDESHISTAGTNNILQSSHVDNNPECLIYSKQSYQERTAHEMFDNVKVNANKDKRRYSEDENKCKDPSHPQSSMTKSLEAKNSDFTETTKKQRKGKEDNVHLKSSFLKPEKTIQEACGIQRNIYGEINESNPEKVIIFLGASGSGKTTLVNFIANYFMGKKSADDNIFHVESTSQTSAVTAYTFGLDKDGVNITIIDTPGLNDCSGAEVRDHVQTLKTFIANASSNGIDIHSIGFVAQAHLVRLTSSERLVMDYVSKMFGQAVSDHLITLVTFADNQDIPPVIEAMKNYGVNFKLFLKFNNSSLSNNKSDEVDDLDRAYWRVCWRNWRKCVKTLKDMAPLSLNTMKAVQNEIYGKTVVKSAENDLLGEMSCFFNLCKTQNEMSEEALQLCETIWELAAIVRRMNHEHSSTENIVVDYALESCKKLGIQSEGCVNLLSLTPSGRLVIGGSEIIRTMAHYYDVAKKWHSTSDTLSRNITEWSYCLKCEKEHKMKRLKSKESSSWGFGKAQTTQVLSLQCMNCKCPGEMHGISSEKSPFHPESVLRYTTEHLSKALEQHSLPGFTVTRVNFLKYLNKHMEHKYAEFIHELLSKA